MWASFPEMFPKPLFHVELATTQVLHDNCRCCDCNAPLECRDAVIGILGILPYVAATEGRARSSTHPCDPSSLYPLTMDHAMAGLPRVKLSDVKKPEAKEMKASRGKSKIKMRR